MEVKEERIKLECVKAHNGISKITDKVSKVDVDKEITVNVGFPSNYMEILLKL